MLCERCRAEIERDPLPPELDEIAGRLTLHYEILRLLWLNRGQWVASDRVLEWAYRGASAPLSAARCIDKTLCELRKRLPPQYRVEARHSWGKRLIVSK